MTQGAAEAVQLVVPGSGAEPSDTAESFTSSFPIASRGAIASHDVLASCGAVAFEASLSVADDDWQPPTEDKASRRIVVTSRPRPSDASVRRGLLPM
jgi:hypothetical protein